MDIKNFYLNTPLKRYEYLKLRLNKLPEDVIKQYNLKNKATPEGYIYICGSQERYVWLTSGGVIGTRIVRKAIE